ncbi:metallophosphoesterase [Zobellia sp. 1_MG-2023]|uniref:metallophosphoesterase family protein n=1 Tax=Zobellia sp. 1_MG-2023 TaxID=3062626 RepID=UPI0026E34326|nr:metallophosphoesterase [Zobellia sp. 1_MG-2023]MDO6820213.1 metallophosphoesterase [Zobellia sp. 1_MG-2023]
MSKKKLSIVIISDLHCHPSSAEVDETYLKTDLLRTPLLDHPVESLVKIIRDDKITTDLTLCPGDFTNKSNKQGFISGWEYSLEIHRELKGKEIIATLGNHDLDSYGSASEYSYEIAKGIKRGFPYKDSNDCDKFWSKGCDFIEKEDYRVLVLNSSHFHYNKLSAKSGKVGDDTLDFIRDYLAKIDDTKFFIVLAHHHPIDHSRLNLGEEDKIVNSDELLEILGKAKADIFVHGHKHDPLLRYHSCRTSNCKIPILSSGSFSSTSNITFTGKKNTFHKVDLIRTDSGNKGKIKTWSFLPRSGWKNRYDVDGFHINTGFGYMGEVNTLATNIKSLVGNREMVKWAEIVSSIPDIEHLIPTQSDELAELLNKNDLILGGGSISEPPKFIGNTKNLI